MNRKRDGFVCNDHQGNALGPTTKKIKSTLPAVDKLNLNNNNDDGIILNGKQSTHRKNPETVGLNGHVKLAIMSNVPPQVFEMLLE